MSQIRTVSDARFHLNIMARYRKTESGLLRFPLMIFYRHAGIRNIDVLVRLQVFLNRHAVLPENIRNTALLQWLDTGKWLRQLSIIENKISGGGTRERDRRREAGRARYSMYAASPVNQSSLSLAKYHVSPVNRIQHGESRQPAGTGFSIRAPLRRPLPANNTAYRIAISGTLRASNYFTHLQVVKSSAAGSFPLRAEADFPDVSIYYSTSQVRNPGSGTQASHVEASPVSRRYGGPGLLHASNYFTHLQLIKPFTSGSLIFKNDATVNLMHQMHKGNPPDTRSLSGGRTGKSSVPGSYLRYPAPGANIQPVGQKPHANDLYFRDTQKISREVEEVRRLAIETQRSAEEKVRALHASGNEEMKKMFNINRISDEVYHTIERRIRTERERRGF